MSFPRLRFLQAGATAEETDQLEAEFESLPERAKPQHLEHLKGLSVYELVQKLEAHRHKDEEPAQEPEADSGAEKSKAGDEGKKPAEPAK